MLFAYLKSSIEIIMLMAFFYYFSLWLKRDKEKNLVWYFYGYYFLFIVTWYGNLNALNAFILYSFPLASILFIIVHQEILQRNFISLKKEAPVAINNQDHLEELLRVALSTLNKNKNFSCILEHTSDLKPFIKTDFSFKAELKQECLSYLIDSKTFDEHKYIWCSWQGYLIAVNAQWRIHQAQPLPELSSCNNQWKEDALLITSKTDACVIKGNPTTRLFDLIARGKLHEKLSAHQMLQLLRIQIIPSPLVGEKVYEQDHKRSYNQQQNS